MTTESEQHRDIPSLADSGAPLPLSTSPSKTAPTNDEAALTGGATTGGFDTMLGVLVVQQGLATEDEVVQCRSQLSETDAATLGDLLLANDFLTCRQLARLRKEFEAKKSTQRIPGYRIKSKLGAGAMATVFLAEQISLDRLVAIKVLPRRFSEDKDFIARFYKEGRAAARLNHPNIVQAIDVGNSGDHHYFVMEYVEGETVYEKIVQDKRLTEREAIDILRQTALALSHAHAMGFIHRDIKPKNIMLSKGGQVKLADLGLARSMDDIETAKAEAGRAYGTPYYISPEQIRGKIDIGPPADIYGLGATAFHMVTGQVPFTGKNPSEVMRHHLKTPLEPPDHINPTLSAHFSQVLEMMLAKDASERYSNANDLLEDLDLLRKGEAPHYARPKLDLADMSAQVTAAPASAQRAKQPTGTELSTFAIVSLVINGLLLLGLLAALMI
jgi:serine/threonine protein kinase